MTGRGRTTASTLAILGIVFVSGITVGRAWDLRAAEAGTVEATEAAAPEETREEGERRRREPMYERVGISDAQRVVIDSLVVHYRNGMRSHQREARAAYEEGQDALVRATREAIMSVMTLEQADEYRALLEASDERRRERRAEREREDEERDRSE